MLQTSRLFTLIFLAVVLGLTAGCGSGDDGTSTADEAETMDEADTDDVAVTDEGEPIPIDLDALQARTWLLRFGGGPTGSIEALDGSPITIDFDRTTFSGTAACNSYSGGYSIDGSQLVMQGLSFTERACEAEIMAAETVYLAALQDVDGINLLGDEMVLSGMSTELIFGPAS